MKRKNGIICASNMSGGMNMRKNNEVFGCIPHGAERFYD